MMMLALCAQGAAWAAPAAAAAAWDTISNTTQCEAMNPAHCVGAYGFVVHADGSFEVGPNPAGKTIRGHLTADELTALHASADAIAARLALQGDATCAPARPARLGTGNSMTLTMAGDKRAHVLAGACDYGAASGVAATLVAAIDTLRAKYYPRPF